jgi:2-polyprenyl-3-methyl-5-hydroxy-6-metoxy-1,4-benzoquinol methylase
MHLTRDQIGWIVREVGQPRASVLLKELFDAYRGHLTSADVASLYDEEYRRRIESHETWRTVAGFRINTYTRYPYEYLAGRVDRTTRILDVGCGGGEFLLALASERGIQGLGIDFDRAAVEEATRRGAAVPGCRFRHGDASAVGQDGPFDVIVLNDVTEHLADGELRALFGSLRGALRGSGEILIHTPNGLALCNETDRSPAQILLKAYLRAFRGWRGFERDPEQIYYDQVHINIKSFRQLQAFLRSVGFRSEVRYDEPGRVPGLGWRSSNMLVIARPEPA